MQLAVAAGDTFVYILKCIGSPSNPWEIETKLSVNTFNYHYTDMIWRLSWSVTGNALVVSHGMNMVDMWKENLDHSWRRIRSMSSEG